LTELEKLNLIPVIQPQTWDVIVVGAGAAGLYAALSLPKQYRVLLLSKEPITRSASDWAQGGLAAAMAPDDSPLLHLEDTLRAGAGLCEPASVHFLVEQASVCVRSLLELGVAFDRDGQELALTLEAAHSKRRVLHAADRTGRALVTTLREQVLLRPNIQILAEALVIKLWMVGDRCQGLLLLQNQQLFWVPATAVLLATGGGGQIFAQTTNPPLSTGDGVALAWHAGAALRDLEFFQFHPTALMKAGAPRFLISEAVRGEGAYLIDHAGERFCYRYDERGELAPRDVVSRAIFQHLEATGEAYVWLDLRHLDPERVRYRFPNILNVCQHWGIDPLEQPIPVAPAAHYWMGGIITDLTGQTSIRSLYALGEVASTGVHGANRLASNSLLECIVFGRAFQSLQLEPLLDCPFGTEAPVLEIPCLNWAVQREKLQQLLWKTAGICRDGKGLATSLNQVADWRRDLLAQPLSQQIEALGPSASTLLSESEVIGLRQWSELHSLLDVSWLILASALFRTESRGGHFRLDYPSTDPAWQVHTVIVGDRLDRVPLGE
jgi:L-aspartate oxidase